MKDSRVRRVPIVFADPKCWEVVVCQAGSWHQSCHAKHPPLRPAALQTPLLERGNNPAQRANQSTLPPIMNTACLPGINVENVALNLKPSLTLVLIYEDTRARERLSWMESRLLQHLGRSYDLRFVWWRLGSLRSLETRRRSLKVAARANVVIFSLCAAEELSSLVKGWLDEWLDARDRSELVLLSLLETGDGSRLHPSSNQSYLQAVAEREKLDFLPYENVPTFPSADGFIPRTHWTLFNGGDV